MVVIWSKEAKLDLKTYIQNSRIYSKNKIEQYMQKLVVYTNSLQEFPNLGKQFYIYKGIEIRQLIFKMHKIFYYIQEDKIIIIQVTHTSRNLKNIIRLINKFFN